jgi:hypothetical protein
MSIAPTPTTDVDPPFPLFRHEVLAAARPAVLWEFDHEALAERLDASGLTIHELSFLVGRSLPMIASYMRGPKAPPAAVIGLLAAVLRCEPGDLFRAVEVVDVSPERFAPPVRGRLKSNHMQPQ